MGRSLSSGRWCAGRHATTCPDAASGTFCSACLYRAAPASADERGEDVAVAGDGEREVGLAGDEVQRGAGDGGGEVAAVGRGDDVVVVALPDVHRHGDVLDAEAPRAGEELVVLDVGVGTLAIRLGDALGEDGLQRGVGG